ncbi:MAG: molecular chaperone DnaJ [Hyphomicrobium sp.]|uniref:molecular chaperone DnaJ n=1 Tax=Hyphomicrobium sp. TaxID=82 RepID=UPI0039E42EF1
MPSGTPLPSSFDLLIEELFGTDKRPAGVPLPNRFSINSLEAAWALASNARGGHPNGNLRRDPYASESASADGTEPMLDPNRILLELGLASNFSEADIATLRREFALRNHPDRVNPELRQLATQRMMIANDLMDRYLARLREGGG